jgi:predicted nucleic acid-binding protein
MIILFDTNVILDVLLDREPFSEPACRLLSFDLPLMEGNS